MLGILAFLFELVAIVYLEIDTAINIKKCDFGQGYTGHSLNEVKIFEKTT